MSERGAGAVRVGSLEFTPDGIYGLEGGARNFFLPRADIRAISIAHGYVGERAALSAAIGALAVVAGLFPLVPFLGAELGAAPALRLAGRASLAGAIVCALGVILIARALRRGLYLRVDMPTRQRKLAIGRAGIDDLTRALGEARDRLGYAIDTTAPEQPARPDAR